MLSERQQSILEAAVEEYVRTAEPVASSELVRKYHLPYSSATVRSELQALDEAGYLSQPHTSAGRVPTDKGYRLFINRKLGTSEPITKGEEQTLKEVRNSDDPIEFMRHASRTISELTRNFAIAGFPEDDLFYKSGMREVMKAPEFSDLDQMQEFGSLIDMIEDRILDVFNREEFVEPKTFIGNENPIREARHWGMIVSSYETPFKKGGMIALIGPKRMDYERNISILKYFGHMLEQ